MALHFLNESQCARIAAMLAAYERGELRGSPPVPSRPPEFCRVEFGKPDATILGVTGLGAQPVGGLVSIYTMSTTGNCTDTGHNITAYNLSTVDVTASHWVHIHRQERSGKYLILGAYENQCIKPLVRVVLATSLNQTNSSVSGAKVTNQYGLGLATSTSMTLNNLAISTNYLFAGSTGHAGYAVPTNSSDAQLTMLECT